jgi:hypothetical protein
MTKSGKWCDTGIELAKSGKLRAATKRALGVTTIKEAKVNAARNAAAVHRVARIFHPELPPKPAEIPLVRLMPTSVEFPELTERLGKIKSPLARKISTNIMHRAERITPAILASMSTV